MRRTFGRRASSPRKTANLKLWRNSRRRALRLTKMWESEGRVTSSSRRSIAGRASRRKVVKPKRLRQIKMGAFNLKWRTREMAANKRGCKPDGKAQTLPGKNGKLR